jgi:hypothetical protein
VVLAGEVDRLGGLVDVIHFVQTNGWSGQLAIVSNTVRKTIYFRKGDIRTAASNVPEDRIGAILFRYGVVSEEVLNEAAQAGAASGASGGGAKIGQLLVERGALTAHELYQYVRKQVEEIFYSVLTLKQGDFYFYRTGDDDGPPSQLQLSTKSLLFEGVRRIDELSYFREKITSSEMVLEKKEPQPSDRLPPRESRVLMLVDGQRDVASLARDSHLGEFETTKILYQLMQSSHVGPRRRRSLTMPAVAQPASTLDDTYRKIIDTFNVVYAKIYAAVATKGKQAPLEKGVESFFGSVAEFAPLFVGVAMASDGTVPKDQVMANLEFAPTDNRLDYLHRGLNELLFFELFTAGEAVDRKEEAELHQRLNEILRDVPLDTDDVEIVIERDPAA